MAVMINGKQEPNPGITCEECNGGGEHNFGLHRVCTRRHRDEGAFVSFKDYQFWMNTIHRPGTDDHKYYRFGQSFCNHFDIHDPGLFYETNAIVCSHAIWTNYIVENHYYNPSWNNEGKIV